MLGLTQKVGSNKLGIAVSIGNNAYLRRSGRHINSHIVQAHLLLGSHDILISGAENLVNIWNRLRAIGHCADSLNTTGFEYLAHSSNLGGYEDGWIYLSVASGRRAENYLAASCYLSRCGKHQDCREQRSRSARNV